MNVPVSLGFHFILFYFTWFCRKKCFFINILYQIVIKFLLLLKLIIIGSIKRIIVKLTDKELFSWHLKKSSLKTWLKLQFNTYL